MGVILNSPTDPLEVLEAQSVATIRRWVAEAQARVAVWEPRPMPKMSDDCSPYGIDRTNWRL